MARLLLLLSIIFMMQCAVKGQVAVADKKIVVIKGIVADQTNKPVPFATIKIKNENIGITTDSLGKFLISANINAALLISSVGFDTTEVFITNNKELLIKLKKNNKSLTVVTIAAKTEASAGRQPTKAQSQNISNALNDFTTGANITTAPAVFYHLKNASVGRPQTVAAFLNNPGSGRIYAGGAIPVFAPKNDTRGRQYLYDHWAAGSVHNEDGTLIKNEKYLFNYDKISKKLLFTQDEKSIFELDNTAIDVFTFLDNGEEVVFKKLLISDEPEFLVMLTPSIGKFQLYKKIAAKLIKADYVNTGLTENGNNYDEFVDDNKYFINFLEDKKLENFELKKKAVLKIFLSYSEKVNNFFDMHKNAQIDERIIIDLIEFLNKP